MIQFMPEYVGIIIKLIMIVPNYILFSRGVIISHFNKINCDHHLGRVCKKKQTIFYIW